MSRLEIRAALSLSSIFALRMLGLFLILPVFALHAKTLPGGNDAFLIGVALGIYGLTQAALQIPFGMASDRFGRKPVIVAGLVLFAIGSFIAAMPGDIWLAIIGRAIQGAGAISAAVTAFLSDLTREENRTKAMALIGASIGLTFAVSLVGAPPLYAAIGMAGMFTMTGVLALLAIAVVIWAVPSADSAPDKPDATEPRPRLSEIVMNPELLRLNLGIFSLHMVQMAAFVVIPVALVQHGELPLNAHWQVYLPALLVSFVLMVPPLLMAEKKGRNRMVLLGAIVLMGLTQAGFIQGMFSLTTLVALLFAFFVAFNLLEAMLPSLVSRIAPANGRGAALGVYNTTQAFGLFAGGALGGWLTRQYGAGAVFALGAVMMSIWFIAAFSMREPHKRARANPQGVTQHGLSQ